MKDTLGKFLLHWRIKTVLPFIKGRLLDIGCGTNQLVKQYKNGIGVDVFLWEGVDLVVENTANLPYNDESFDSITIIAALNHIPNRKEVLQEANRILSKEGIIIITMIPPTLSKIWHTLRKPWDSDQTERGMKEGEVYGIGQSDLHELLNGAEFEIINEKRFMCYLNHLIIAKKHCVQSEK